MSQLTALINAAVEITEMIKKPIEKVWVMVREGDIDNISPGAGAYTAAGSPAIYIYKHKEE